MITSKQMKELERSAMHHGITASELMENAGKQFFQAVRGKFDLKGKNVVIFCGTGNNGGDGFVAARLLCEEAETDVLFIGDETRFKEEAEINFKKIENNEKIQILIDPEQIDFDDYDIIIDAILGTGASGELKEVIRLCIDLINNSKAYKIAVDIPTGINPDTGEIAEKTVNADLIITFHDIKQGLEKFKDKTIIFDIGIKK